jgi:hypothetical protein
MKTKSLLLAICFAVATIPAHAAGIEFTKPAFESFHVRLPIDATDMPYNCITEDYGAVVNGCTFEVHLVFDLPVYQAVVHTLNVQNYVSGTGTTGATCNVWSYDGNGNGREGTNLTFNASGEQTLTFTSIKFGNSLALLCDIPVGEGISAITWNP